MTAHAYFQAGIVESTPFGPEHFGFAAFALLLAELAVLVLRCWV